MKKIKPIALGVTFTALALIGFKVPAEDITAEETSPINAYTKSILEDHKEEVEEATAIKEAECKEAYDNRAEDYKMQAQASLDRVSKSNEKTGGYSNAQYVGTYQLTAYIATGNRCASGVYPTVNHTVACNSLPLGTRIYIEGYGEYVVEDTGGMSGGVIDVFVSDYGSAIQFGRRSANVYVIED